MRPALVSVVRRKGKNSDVEIAVAVVALEGTCWRYVLALNRSGRGNETPVVSREEVWCRATAAAQEERMLVRPNSFVKVNRHWKTPLAAISWGEFCFLEFAELRLERNCPDWPEFAPF
jgi:hypothetical protein